MDDTLGSGTPRPVLPMVVDEDLGGYMPVVEGKSTSRALYINQALARVPGSLRELLLGWHLHPTFSTRPARLRFGSVPLGTTDAVYSRSVTASYLGHSSSAGTWGASYAGDKMFIYNISDSTVTHELGHHLDMSLNFEATGSTAFLSSVDTFLRKIIAEARAKMLANSMNGMYAYTNSSEWFAESWTMQIHSDYLGASGMVGSYRPFYDICGRDPRIAGEVRQWFLEAVPDLPRMNWYFSRDGAASNRDKPCITGWSIPAGMVRGESVSITLLDESALPTASWAVVDGELPAGLSLTSAGNGATIGGTVSEAGDYAFTIRATNADGYLDRVYAGRVFDPDIPKPVVTTPSSVTWTWGKQVSETSIAVEPMTPFQLEATNGPLTWRYVNEYPLPLLPLSLSGDASGLITGTLQSSGGAYKIEVENAGGVTEFTLNVTTREQAHFNTPSLNAMTVGVAFSQQIYILGAKPWTDAALDSGTIPEGLALTVPTSSGTRFTLTGTPTTAGPYSFTLRLANAYGSQRMTYSGTIAASV